MSRDNSVPFLLLVVLVFVTGRYVECHKEPQKYADWHAPFSVSTEKKAAVMGTVYIKNTAMDNSSIKKIDIRYVDTRRRHIECDNPNFNLVRRAEWQAVSPVSIEDMVTPVGIVFIHHTAMDYCYTLSSCSAEVRKIQDFHIDIRGWDDIGYNFLVGEDGCIYEARGWDRVGAHTKGYNRIAVSISVMGDFTNRIPNKKALDAIGNIINRGIRLGKILPNYKLYGHRDARPTESPGSSLYAYMKTWPHFDHNKPVNTN